MKNIFNKFHLGVNYWPRHRGVNMWTDWHPEEIDSEFAEIAGAGMDTVRVFLVWKEFQPIREVYTGGGYKLKVCFKNDENVTPDNNPEMIDSIMSERFEKVLELGEKHNLKLIPTLFTVWMSGELLLPEFLDGRNIFSDPAILRYQALYAGYFAKKFRNHPAILAWDLGNEQNNVHKISSQDSAWLWTNYLTTVLKRFDPETPVTSGIHGLGMSRYLTENAWQLQDVADNCDFTSPHPYPGFYKECIDGLDSLSASLLPAFLVKLYSGIGGKPAMCEEYGSLGTGWASDEISAKFARRSLYSQLANGSAGALWWCFSDFSCIYDLPYSVNQMEPELGMFDVNGHPKPVVKEFKKFSEFLKNIDYADFKKPEAKAAIIVPAFEAFKEDQAKIFMAFLLCKQAGIEAEIIRPEVDFSKYDLMIMPSCAYRSKPISNKDWERAQARVKAGAVLFLSYENCILRNIDKVFGIKTIRKLKNRQRGRILRFVSTFGNFNVDDELKFPENGNTWTLEVEPVTGKVAALNTENRPALIINDYGKGKAILCLETIETLLAGVPGVFENDAYRIYSTLKSLSGTNACVSLDNPFIERIVHSCKNHRILILINHGEQERKIEIKFNFNVTETVQLDNICKIISQGPDSLVVAMNSGDAGVFKLRH